MTFDVYWQYSICGDWKKGLKWYDERCWSPGFLSLDECRKARKAEIDRWVKQGRFITDSRIIVHHLNPASCEFILDEYSREDLDVMRKQQKVVELRFNQIERCY